jgi:predicted Rossmann fold nucleotide-binding protein DprA/Smf involved in DNA uptake
MAETDWLEAALAALYLPGLRPEPGAHRRSWPACLAAMRRAGHPDRAADALGAAGRWHEAALLRDKERWAAAQRLAEQGRLLTAAGAAWPKGWEALGSAAPPVLWASAPLPPGPWLGVVGSRAIGPADRRWAASLPAACGAPVVSGGAPGSDNAAGEGARKAGLPLIEILPCGIDGAFGSRGAIRVSAAAPGEDFRTALAMERNALIFAAARICVVVRAAEGRGGSWAGAQAALRRRLGRPAAQNDQEDAGCQALIRLGALPVRDAEELADIWAAPDPAPLQPRLAPDLVSEPIRTGWAPKA